MDGFRAIPQLFFDLIARITPGAVAIFAWSAAMNVNVIAIIGNGLKGGPPSVQDSAFLIIAICLGLAYLIGHLLSLSGTVFSNVIFRLVLPTSYQVLRTAVRTDYKDKSRYPTLVRKFLSRELRRTMQKNAGSMKPDDKFIVTTFIWYDWLNVHMPGAGTKAQKIYAEYFMYAEVTVALFSAILLHFITTLFNLNWTLLSLLAVGCVVSFICTLQHFRTFQWNVIQQYYVARNGLLPRTKRVQRVRRRIKQRSHQTTSSANSGY